MIQCRIQCRVQWTWQSNACDVLSLGPSTAGRLATVGIRTVAELLSANAQAIADRLNDARYPVAVLAAWQREARLIVELPTLPPLAARLLSAAGCGSSERIACSAPTELLTMIESIYRADDRPGWLPEENKPTIGEVCEWIGCAREKTASRAA